jgi:hypothetical protein
VNFEPTEEEESIITALDRILAPFRTLSSTEVVNTFVYAERLERSLLDAGFYDAGAEGGTPAAAALIVTEVAKLPVCVEIAASVLVRPRVCPDAPPGVALIAEEGTRPTRFLPQARTALFLSHGEVRRLKILPGDVEPLESVFAYPIGRLTSRAVGRAEVVENQSDALLMWWRIGIALEIYGALQAAQALTLEHVKNRTQFGRPIGSLQAVQHRLAMSATAVESIRWLALRAALSDSAADAAIAAAYAQQAVKTIVYDLHQFSGAMGLTKEYSLHLFTYRARMLQSELGGYAAQITAAAEATWPDALPSAQTA